MEWRSTGFLNSWLCPATGMTSRHSCRHQQPSWVRGGIQLSAATIADQGTEESVGPSEAPTGTETVRLQVPDENVLVGNSGLFPLLLITSAIVTAQHFRYYKEGKKPLERSGSSSRPFPGWSCRSQRIHVKTLKVTAFSFPFPFFKSQKLFCQCNWHYAFLIYRSP